MSHRVIPGAAGPSKIPTIWLAVALLSFSGVASGQVEAEGEANTRADPSAEGTAEPAPAPKEPAEEPSSEGEAGETTELPVEDPSADEELVEEEPAEEEPVDDGTSEPDDDVVDPLDEEDTSFEEEPDYFGSYEPLAPSARANPEYAPEKPRYNGPFSMGRFSFGFSLGAIGIDNESHLITGLNIGYFLANGLQFHLDTDIWLIGNPTIITPSPGLRYVFWMVPKVHPYVGAFYRRYIVTGDAEGVDAVGGRGGVYFDTGPLSYFGVGAYYERMLQDRLFSVDAFYGPEIAFGFAF